MARINISPTKCAIEKQRHVSRLLAPWKGCVAIITVCPIYLSQRFNKVFRRLSFSLFGNNFDKRMFRFSFEKVTSLSDESDYALTKLICKSLKIAL